MLFIHGAISLGGIETFYLRMAKVRHAMKMKTKILLVAKKKSSDANLLSELQNYANVYFLEDFLSIKIFRFFSFHFLLLKPINYQQLSMIFKDICHVHVSSSILGIFFLKIAKKLKLKIPLTIGVYHAREFIWGDGEKLPFYERVNRIFFQEMVLGNAVCFFNEKLPVLYSQYFELDVKSAHVFPLGVIDAESFPAGKTVDTQSLQIVSVGRLVSFKSYNLWMLNVVLELKERLNLKYFVYGDGPLKEEMESFIRENDLESTVFLCGDLPYSEFKKVVSKADIFVGSGTAVVEASSLGVPSIVGVESVEQPLSYGFACDIPGFSYNEDNLYSKKPAMSIILNFSNLSEQEKEEVRFRHFLWSKKFDMKSCVKNFDSVRASSRSKEVRLENKMFFSLRYSLSFFVFSIMCKFKYGSISVKVYG